MIDHCVSFVFTVLVWWLGTGVILKLCTLPRRTFRWSMLGASVMLAAAFYGLSHAARMTDTGGVYLSFISAIGVWGWIEMSFLMGFVTGPRITPCPNDAAGWRRFGLALATLLYHELMIVAAAAAIITLTWGLPNQTGTMAFLILAVMRASAKLNIFLGVPNLTDSLLPERLGYLKSYFRRRSFNLLFPLSIAGGVLGAARLAGQVFDSVGAEAVGAALLLTLLTLAMLEHFFMMMPIPDGALWFWAMPASAAKPIQRPAP